MKPGLVLFLSAVVCAAFWSLLFAETFPTLSRVVVLTAFVVLLLYVIATEWAIPAAIARLTVRRQPVLPLVTADDADQVYRELLSAAMNGQCWHAETATVPGCGCVAERKAMAQEIQRQTARFRRGPVRMVAGQ